MDLFVRSRGSIFSCPANISDGKFCKGDPDVGRNFFRDVMSRRLEKQPLLFLTDVG